MSISVSAGGFSRGWMSVARCEKITGPGNVAGGGTAEVFGAFINAENRRWTALVTSAGIRLE